MVGGGVASAAGMFLPLAVSEFAGLITGAGHRPMPRVELARFGDRAGIIGAALLAAGEVAGRRSDAARQPRRRPTRRLCAGPSPPDAGEQQAPPPRMSTTAMTRVRSNPTASRPGGQQARCRRAASADAPIVRPFGRGSGGGSGGSKCASSASLSAWISACWASKAATSSARSSRRSSRRLARSSPVSGARPPERMPLCPGLWPGFGRRPNFGQRSSIEASAAKPEHDRRERGVDVLVGCLAAPPRAGRRPRRPSAPVRRASSCSEAPSSSPGVIHGRPAVTFSMNSDGRREDQLGVVVQGGDVIAALQRDVGDLCRRDLVADDLGVHRFHRVVHGDASAASAP